MRTARRWAVVCAICLVVLPAAAWAQVAPLPQTGQTKCYNTAGAEIPCAGTGQDGDIRAGVAWPSPRFTNADGSIPVTGGVVLDQLTGLTWARDAGAPTVGSCGGGPKYWPDSLGYVACLNAASYLGYSDWRLPNVIELESLATTGAAPGAWLNTQGFTNVSTLVPGSWWGDGYWSSTTIGNYAGGAWDVLFYAGNVSAYNDKVSYFDFLSWPVRGGSSGGRITLPRTGQTTSYAAGDDGQFQRGTAWPNPRFTNLDGSTPVSGDVVVDHLTGLMWTRDGNAPGPTMCHPAALKSWQGALDYVACLNANSYLGYTGWRLPNRREMMSITNWGQSDVPTWLTGAGFINVQTTRVDPGHTYFLGYWSSTTVAPDPATAWYVWMIYGAPDNPSPKTYAQFVWPVRDAAAPPPPAPIVDAGPDQALTADLLGRATVALNATITNPPAFASSFAWNDGAGHQANTASASFTLGIGSYTFTVIATDANGNTSTDSMAVNVQLPTVAGQPGPQGVKGDTGTTGATGAIGPTGPQGAKGDTGATGAIGATGPQGVKGDTGATGAQGSQGVKGDAGAAGATGPIGPIGPQGGQGVKGDTGAIGPTGPQGPQGVKGDAGAVGATGPIGPIGPQGGQGVKGDTGATGSTGAAGPQGLQGETGPVGLTGAKGDKGDTGAIGPQGPAGPTGPAGPMGAVGPLGPAGPAGPTGATGPTGLQGATGLRGEGLFSGALAFVERGTSVPAGYALVGSFRQALGNGPPMVIDVYRKN